MSLAAKVTAAWRKNSPELLGFVNGALPDFVTARGRGGELDGIPVYSYHVVEAATFEEDLRFLRRNGYQALGLDALLARIAGAVAMTGREVALTFDDGPRNFHDVAFPLLQRYGFCATAFVAPGLHAEHYGEFEALAQRPMTWTELRRVQDSGLVSVQSHTLQSQYVPRWPEAVPLAGVDSRIERSLRRPPLPMREDFLEARRLIESQCPGALARHLCYPMYHATAEALEAAAQAGYLAGYGGLIPGNPVVRSGAQAGLLPRLSWEFLRRMPGDGRITLTDLLRNRLHDAARARARQKQLAGAS